MGAPNERDGAGARKPSNISRTKRPAPPRLPRGAGRGYGGLIGTVKDAEPGVTGTVGPADALMCYN